MVRGRRALDPAPDPLRSGRGRSGDAGDVQRRPLVPLVRGLVWFRLEPRHVLLRNATHVLWPPNPNEFDRASRTSRSRATFGVTSSSISGSGVRWWIVGGIRPFAIESAHAAPS